MIFQASKLWQFHGGNNQRETSSHAGSASQASMPHHEEMPPREQKPFLSRWEPILDFMRVDPKTPGILKNLGKETLVAHNRAPFNVDIGNDMAPYSGA